MPFRIIYVPKDIVLPEDLTDSELLGISIYLAEDFRRFPDSGGVYQDAWHKLQFAAELAMKEEAE